MSDEGIFIVSIEGSLFGTMRVLRFAQDDNGLALTVPPVTFAGLG